MLRAGIIPKQREDKSGVGQSKWVHVRGASLGRGVGEGGGMPQGQSVDKEPRFSPVVGIVKIEDKYKPGQLGKQLPVGREAIEAVEVESADGS
jgi:hypothetical protein